jgi:ADP-ribose pyrophosphatase
MLHTNARSATGAYAGMRAPVPDALVPWDVEWKNYAPIEFTHPIVLAQPPWADPPDVIARPRNPRGRTGTTGRGLLGKWGANKAADPIVLRRSSDGNTQMAAIRRADTGAIPGGMVDDGEHISAALKREFTEEAASKCDPALVADIFGCGLKVYEGYVDDPRNTNNAWMETSVYVYKAPSTVIELCAGSDATRARWINVDELTHLYADHRMFLDKALAVVKM